MIKLIYLSRTGSYYLVDVTNTLITVVGEYVDALPFLQPYLTHTQTKYGLFVSTVERSNFNPLFKARDETDETRIKSYLSSRKYYEACAARRDPALKEAAEHILTVFQDDKVNVGRMGMKKRTGVITAVISELRSKYATEIAITKSDEYLKELETVEAEFETAFRLAMQYETDNPEPTLAEVRPQLADAIRSMLTAIDFQQKFAPSATLDELISKINDIIIKTSSTVKAGTTRAANAKEKENTTDPDATNTQPEAGSDTH